MAALLLGRGFEVLGLTSTQGAAELDLNARFPHNFRTTLFDYDTPLRIGDVLEDIVPRSSSTLPPKPPARECSTIRTG